MTPSIGRIVHYALTEKDVADITRRRDDYKLAERPADGAQAHVGNPVAVNDVVALQITRVWPNGLVNGQAVLDGTDTLWVTSAAFTDHAEEGILILEPGTWIWPPRV